MCILMRPECCAVCAQVWNPGFDVTPSSLIRGVITEHGVIGQHDNTINVNGFMHSKGLLEDTPLENGALACAALVSACCTALMQSTALQVAWLAMWLLMLSLPAVALT